MKHFENKTLVPRCRSLGGVTPHASDCPEMGQNRAERSSLRRLEWRLPTDVGMPLTVGHAYADGMSREHMRTPEESIAAEFGRVVLLFGQALPSEVERTRFERLTAEASARGLNWVEALEYAALKRSGLYR